MEFYKRTKIKKMFRLRNVRVIILSKNFFTLFNFRAAIKKTLKLFNFIWFLFEYALGLVTYDDSDGSHSDDDSGDDYGTSCQKNNSDDDSESELKVNFTFCDLKTKLMDLN